MGNRHKLQNRRSLMNIRGFIYVLLWAWKKEGKKNQTKLFFYCEDDWTLEEITQRVFGVSILGNILNISGSSPGWLALGGPVSTPGLYQLTSRDFLSPVIRWFCDSVNATVHLCAMLDLARRSRGHTWCRPMSPQSRLPGSISRGVVAHASQSLGKRLYNKVTNTSRLPFPLPFWDCFPTPGKPLVSAF